MCCLFDEVSMSKKQEQPEISEVVAPTDGQCLALGTTNGPANHGRSDSRPNTGAHIFQLILIFLGPMMSYLERREPFQLITAI
jgi:hypothetical protein